MSDDTLTDRVTRVEVRQHIFEKQLMADLAEIKGTVRMLLEREYERRGAVGLTRALIAALAALAGGMGGWLGHFWWNQH